LAGSALAFFLAGSALAFFSAETHEPTLSPSLFEAARALAVLDSHGASM
jgi:hypothetical protein